jgi:hypothetical protein
VEECTYFWGVNTSWGINTAKSKGPLNQEDNQAPQPTDNDRVTHKDLAEMRRLDRDETPFLLIE